MARITLEKVKKTYPNGFEALHGLDLDVSEGEFMVLVGPSGCGKTTVLRMVAGLEPISEGILRFDERVVNKVSAQDRDIAMVFQDYALYPQMTVAQNIAFALKLKRMDKREIERRVQEAAKILDLTVWLDRKPSQLSGGQSQRVAMGRALVREPSVFLMDEPLSNLDAKLRVQMRAEMLRLQRRLGVATLYVTHDQTEAMTMGDRVAVMRSGELQQCDTPQVLYDRPANLFVATCIGSPAMNLFEGGISADGQLLVLGSQQLRLTGDLYTVHPLLRNYANNSVIVGIRPEDLAPVDASGGSSTLIGRVDLVESLGSELHVHFQTDADRVREQGTAEGAGDLEAGQLGVRGEAVARIDPRTPVKVGDPIVLAVTPERFHFFDPSSGEAIFS